MGRSLKLLYKFIFFLVMLFCQPQIKAQSHCEARTFVSFLSSVREIHQIEEDNNGFIWIASSNGLHRYDGYEFVSFDLGNIRKLYKDGRGNFWCLIHDRAYVFDLEKYKFIDVLEVYETEAGRSFRVDKIRTGKESTRLYCEGGLCHYVNYISSDSIVVASLRDEDEADFHEGQSALWYMKKGQLYVKKQDRKYEPLSVNVKRVVDDKAHNLWIISESGKIYTYDFETDKLSVAVAPANIFYNRIKRLKGGQILIGGQDEVCLLESMTANFQRIEGCKSINNVYFDREGRMYRLDGANRFFEDRFGFVYAFMENESIMCFDKKDNKFMPLVLENVDMRGVNHYFADSHGNLWIWDTHKLYCLSFSRKPYELTIDKEAKRVLYAEDNGRYWIGDRNKPIVRIYNQDNSLAGYLGMDGALHNDYVEFFAKVYAIFKDSHGLIWLGTKPKGLFRLTPEQDGYIIDNFNQENSEISSNEIVDIAEDSYGRIWVASYVRGIDCIVNSQAEKPNFLNADNCFIWPKGENRKVRGLTVSSSDILFAATQSGLFIADLNLHDLSRLRLKSHHREYGRPESLSSDAVLDIFEMPTGRIFITTENAGFNEIVSKNMLDDKLDFKHFDKTNLLASDICQSVIGYDNRLLVSSFNCLIDFDTDDETVNTFFLGDNLTFCDATPIRLSDGSFLFGLTEGTLRMDIDSLMSVPSTPPLKFTGVKIGSLPPVYNPNTHIILENGERDVMLSFATLDNLSPSGVRYAFMIKEHDDKWKYIDEPKIYLADLSPGEYTLCVRSTNSEGIWVDNMITVNIDVLPTFSETTHAKILYFLLICIFVFAVIRIVIYVRRIRRNQAETLDKYLKLINNRTEVENNADICDSREAEALSIQPDSTDDQFVNRVMEFIELHFSDTDIYIDDMAAYAAVSKSLLNKKIKRLVGRTPLELIRDARMRKASMMLTESNCSISEISDLCGFADSKYFAKCFKQYYGLTPLEFRVKNSKL